MTSLVERADAYLRVRSHVRSDHARQTESTDAVRPRLIYSDQKHPFRNRPPMLIKRGGKRPAPRNSNRDVTKMYDISRKCAKPSRIFIIIGENREADPARRCPIHDC